MEDDEVEEFIEKRHRALLSDDSESEGVNDEDDDEVPVMDIDSFSDDEESDEGEDRDASDADDQHPRWGSRRRVFYGGDNADLEMDGEISSTDGKDLEDEEQEALRIQQSSLAQLANEDFVDDESVDPRKQPELESSTLLALEIARIQKELGLSPAEGPADAVLDENTWAGLSAEERVRTIELLAPEAKAIIRHISSSTKDLARRCFPRLFGSSHIKECSARNISLLFTHVLSLYVTNLVFYLLLRASGRPPRDHPVVERIVQLKSLLDQIGKFRDEIDSSFSLLLSSHNIADEDTNPSTVAKVTDIEGLSNGEAQLQRTPQKFKPKPRSLKRSRSKSHFDEDREKDEALVHSLFTALPSEGVPPTLSQSDRQETSSSQSEDAPDFDTQGEDRPLNKSVKTPTNKEPGPDTRAVSQQYTYVDKVDEGGRRAISDQILKNRGLTPYRSKSKKNPRVKHRAKFQRAVVRRRGAVRDYKGQEGTYRGEISGINIRSSRSTKLRP
eukprot:CAMPEP_0184688822 /NCGR_PEP_ID=MMETSP0312-20130426/30305_1 /TAXON_ID=31354 /ORGANISM="Compsopogon coeruleus, Strain SAG 36.94" /LENGTH=500 /DNA_ID=CAMNT_0027146091 /DNA_START=3641 /DNA_END=5143 /DNA_ORIENTATION=+